jgi:hypothetical protein
MSVVSTLLPRNEGTADRLFRVALGIALVVMVFAGPKSPWGLIGLFPLATGLLGSCPAYRPFGVSTRRLHRIGRSGEQSPTRKRLVAGLRERPRA